MKGTLFRITLFMLPVLVFVAVVFFFAFGLGKNPQTVRPVLIDVPAPVFSLAGLPGSEGGLSSEDLKGQVSLLNVFGSWCPWCAVEHDMLMTIRKSGLVTLYGINWRDQPDDALAWLEKKGNPYEKIGVDPESRTVIDFGVTGAPETFVIDRTGTIRYKWMGPIKEDVWEEVLIPVIEELNR